MPTLSQPIRSSQHAYLERSTPRGTFMLSQGAHHHQQAAQASQRILSLELSKEENLSQLKTRLKALHPHIPPTIEKVKEVAAEIFPDIADQITKVSDPFLRNLCSFKLKILTYSDQNLTPQQLEFLKIKLEEKDRSGLTEKTPISLRALFEVIQAHLHVFMERPDVRDLNQSHKWEIFIEKPTKKLTLESLKEAISEVGSRCIAIREHLYDRRQIDIDCTHIWKSAQNCGLQVKDSSTLKSKDVDQRYESALVEHYKEKKLVTSFEIQEFIERTYKERPPRVYITKLEQAIAYLTSHNPIVPTSQKEPSCLSTATFATLIDKLDNKVKELNYTPYEAYSLFTNRLKAHVKSIYPEAITASQLEALKEKLEGSTPTVKDVQEKAQEVLGGDPLPLDHIKDLCSFVWGIKTKISGAEVSLTAMQKAVIRKLYSSASFMSGRKNGSTYIRQWVQKDLLIQASMNDCKIISQNLGCLEKKQTLNQEELSELRAYCQHDFKSKESVGSFIRKMGVELASESEAETQADVILNLCTSNDIPVGLASSQRLSLAEACKNLDLEEFPITQEKIRKMVKDQFNISLPPTGGVSKFCEEILTLTSKKLYKNTKKTLQISPSKLNKINLKKVTNHLVLSQNSHSPSIAEVETALRNTHEELYADGQNPPSHQEIRDFCVFVWDIHVTPELEEGETLSSELQKLTLLNQPAKIS